MKKISIGYVTATWGRPWLTEQVFRHVAAMRDMLAADMDIIPAAAGSESAQSRKLAEDNGFLYVEAPNNPLGAKWNAALALLRSVPQLDGVCVMGSDDIANEPYFRRIAALVREGHELLGMSGLYFLEQDSGRLLYWRGYPPPRENDSAGAGRFIGRRILDGLDWQLWPDTMNGGLDRAMRDSVKKGGHGEFKPVPCRDGECVVVDIKGRGGMNSFETIAASGESMLVGRPRDFFERNFGPALADSLFSDAKDAAGSDVWLWRCWSNSVADMEKDHVWCVEKNRFSASALDFMNACRDAGYGASWVALREYLDRKMPDAHGFLYGAPDAETLFAHLLDERCPKVLECRNIADESLRQLSFQLPWTCVGNDGWPGALPLPFSEPPGYPGFEQRNHIVICLDDTELAEVISTLWLSKMKQDNSTVKLFFTEWPQVYFVQKEKGMEYLPDKEIFPLRGIFRAVVFTPKTYARLGTHFLAGGTPGICLGPWSWGKQPDCIVDTKSISYALAVAARLTRDSNLWRKMSEKTVSFARENSKRFAAALNHYSLQKSGTQA